MPETSPPLLERQAEIRTFIAEGTHRIATIWTNNCGFLLSSRMAETYLIKAVHILESKRLAELVISSEIRILKASAERLYQEYVQLERFCIDCERFNHLITTNRIEWISKLIVRAISRSYLKRLSYHLAHKISRFHSRTCSILIEN